MVLKLFYYCSFISYFFFLSFKKTYLFLFEYGYFKILKNNFNVFFKFILFTILYIINLFKLSLFFFDLIVMVLNLYYNYIKIFYFYKIENNLIKSNSLKKEKKKSNINIGSPDLNVYYPMIYAMKSVMVRLTGIILFLSLFIILISEFMTTYITTNFILFFDISYGIRFGKLCLDIVDIDLFKDGKLYSLYRHENTNVYFYFIKCISYLAFSGIITSFKFVVYQTKIFLFLAWIIINYTEIFGPILFYNILTKNIFFVFFIIHFYYTFFHTYKFINNSFNKIIKFSLDFFKFFFYWFKIFINFFVLKPAKYIYILFKNDKSKIPPFMF